MRGLILLVVLAAAFGAAGLWQRQHVAELRAAQRALQGAGEEEPAAPEREALEPGEAVLLVGRPSGAEPRPRPQAQTEQAPTPPAPPQANESTLGDYTTEVQPGQTLSGIAYLRYGTAGPELVAELAAYNGLASADRVKAGQVLRLPPLEVLQGPDAAKR